MVESKPPEDRLSVAIVQRIALVRVEGRGSFKVSTSLKEFVQAAVEGGAQTAVVDMTNCASMDSTFMGVLAGAAGRLKNRNQGRLVLVNLSAKTRALISTLGLDQVVAAFDAGQTPAEFAPFVDGAACFELAAGGDSQRATAQTVLEAHETLAALTPENRPRFKDVLEFMREDLKRKSAPSGVPP